MIKLEFDGLPPVEKMKEGRVLHLKVLGVVMTSPGRWMLKVHDVTPLPGVSTYYECEACGLNEEPNADGGLPEGWVTRFYRGGQKYLCPDCCDDRICRVCGCSDNNACAEGCSWVESDLCSTCVGK